MSVLPTSSSQTAFYNNPQIRSVIYQVILTLALGYFFYLIVSNTLANMQSRGIQSGFAFLDSTAGFDILMSLIPYDATYTYGRTFLVGILNTILVSIISIVLATIVGFIIGVSFFSQNWLIRTLARIYVETFRNIPLLLQIFFWYFAVLSSLPGARQSLSIGEVIFLNVRGLYLPDLIAEAAAGYVYAAMAFAIVGVWLVKRWAKKRQDLTGQQFPVFPVSLAMLIVIPVLALVLTDMPFQWEFPVLRGFNYSGGITVIPELIALAISLTIYTGAFIGEAVRAGVQSVPHGQTEAARSIGLKERQIMKLIIVPQAMCVITPILNSEYQSLVKNSTLATAIGYPDLFTVFVGTTLNQTGQAIEIVFMTMAVYLLFNMIISVVMNLFNRKVALVSR